MVPMVNQNPGCYNHFYVNVFFCLGALTFIILTGLFFDDSQLYIAGIVICYLIQLIEGTCCCSTRKYLGNIECVSETFKIVDKMRFSRPIIQFHI